MTILSDVAAQEEADMTMALTDIAEMKLDIELTKAVPPFETVSQSLHCVSQVAD